MVLSKLVKPSSFVFFTSFLSITDAAGLGSWGPTITFPTVPVAAAVFHETGDLFIWSAYAKDRFQVGKAGYTQSALYDTASGAITSFNITNTGHDMFCPGVSTDFKGRVVVTGGDTAAKTSIHDGVSGGAWVAGGDMTVGRGYQSSTTCSDGRIFTIGGAWSGPREGKGGEIFDPSTNKWTALSGCPVKPMLTNDKDGIFRQDSHAWLFGWKDGYVFQAGPSKAMNWYGTSGNGSQLSAGTRGDDSDAMTGMAVMVDATIGKILAMGGAANYQDTNATANANIITIGTPNTAASVKKINSMWYPRSFANGVVLPDGNVFIVGGQTYAVPFTDTTAVMTPELWNATTNKFIKMAVGPTPRTYHSVGLLMPDATIFSGGGGLCGSCSTNHFDGQFYSPPYLFQADGKTLAARPTIKTISTTTIKLGSTITVTTQNSVSSFSLIRMGGTTHTVNTDQRRIPLSPVTTVKTQYTLSIPSDAGVALPGYWYLFALSSTGTPSNATIVQITP